MPGMTGASRPRLADKTPKALLLSAVLAGAAVGTLGLNLLLEDARSDKVRTIESNAEEPSGPSKPVTRPDEGGIDAAQVHLERMAACMRGRGYRVSRSPGGGHEISGPPGPIEIMMNDREACRQELGVRKGDPSEKSGPEREAEAEQQASPSPSD